MSEHDHTPNCGCLPIRVVVDQHGHYWRDYGDHWSMCPVSTENVATEPVSEFYPLDSPETVTVVEGHNHTTDGLPTFPVFRDACPQGCDAPLGPTEQVEVTPGRFSPRPRLFVVDPMREAYALAAVQGQLPADIEPAHTLDLDSPETVERLAAVEHDQWMTWARSVMSADDVTIGPERLARWQSYMVPYADLSEPVKEHDRKWARGVLAALREGTA